jgi:rhodanese-related sulfurtransferase
LEYFVDTCIKSSLPVSSLFISPQELGSLLGRADSPLLLDVRPKARFDASKYMLATAQRCAPADLAALIVQLTHAATPIKQRLIVTYCVYGHHVSVDAAATLRAAGLNACALAGGFEGGEDGVDNAKQVTQWRLAAVPKIEKVVK